ncbi:MAG: signal recognition particle-docking protein FtsY [Victivallaceae bacterium]|nr:signal recognition particle-docking protein FtsY [Victivallaceae bacterium]
MKTIFSVFKRGLQKTTTSMSRSLASVFSGTAVWDDETFEDLEAMLISADFGVKAALNIVDDIRDRYSRGMIETSDDIFKVAAEDVCTILQRNIRPVNYQSGAPTIIMMIGVNGSGKTTTAGKLAARWVGDNRKVMLAACDTFRAAAVEQLTLWSERTGSSMISALHGADPASVAFDATKAAIARNMDVLLLDTAGRQHNNKGLMEELAKMRRSIVKACPGAPHEVWLTVDASLGSNAVNQAREFSRFADITGLILTKLDGTGKGGMAVALQQEFSLPVFFVGLGEQPDDLQPFDPGFYSSALFGVGK